MGSLYDIDKEMLQSLVDTVINVFKILKQKVEPIVLESVFQTNLAFIKCYDWTKKRRKELPTLDSHLSQIENGAQIAASHIRHFLRYFVYNSVELTYYPWISVSKYNRAENVSSFVTETSNKLPNIVDTYLQPEEKSFEEAFSRVYRSIESSNTSNQTLITMATGTGSRIVAVWNSDRPDFVPSMEKSNIDFILVEYGHPKMKGLMQINLPDSVYMVGNEILSKTFVLRYLNHSCIPYTWHFDEDYIIRIIDHNADSLEIRSHQYIVLEKDGYKVVEDEYADLPDLLPVDSIDNFMCVSDSENESPSGYISPEELESEEETKDAIPEKRTYSIDDAVFVLDDFLDDTYTNKIDSIVTKPKQD